MNSSDTQLGMRIFSQTIVLVFSVLLFSVVAISANSNSEINCFSQVDTEEGLKVQSVPDVVKVAAWFPEFNIFYYARQGNPNQIDILLIKQESDLNGQFVIETASDDNRFFHTLKLVADARIYGSQTDASGVLFVNGVATVTHKNKAVKYKISCSEN